MISSIRVDLGERSYDIVAGTGLLGRVGELIRPNLATNSVFVVTDENVERHHLARLQAGLDDADISHHGVVMPAGEQTKDFPHLESLLASMLEAGCERATTILAFGGGVIGDLSGFAASALLRGVPFIQVPTTLLSQVDSSVGGKTGINMPQGKNLVGSFYQPKMVIADIDTLSTLPTRELASGYAEVVKYGLIGDAGFFSWLETRGRALLDGDTSLRQSAVLESCKAKARVVAADERESGLRAHLNFGHTFAHIFEAECGYDGTLTHGEAVAIGMVMAFELSARMNLCPASDTDRVVAHFRATGLPTTLPARTWNIESLLSRLSADKKVRDGRVTFILTRGIGEVFATADVPQDSVRAVIERHFA